MPKPYTPNDKWSQRAAKEGYRARSVYKLMELDERFRLLRPGMTVLDLGAAPGSWMQYTSQKVGPLGKVIGFDIQTIDEVADNVAVYREDITDDVRVRDALEAEAVDQVDLVLSDIAPSTSGVKDVDQVSRRRRLHHPRSYLDRGLIHGSAIYSVESGAG